MSIVREATEEDIKAIAGIYRYYVEETAISFEYEAPDENEMRSRLKEYSGRYPFLVIEEGGTVKGYAYAHPFSYRAAYYRSAEITVYLDRHSTGKGYGTQLYRELEKRLKDRGITNLYAIIMYPGYGSVNFHEKNGYKIVGKLTDCGEKFGRLWSVVYMEKII